jgi:hypothetical protein
MHTRTHAHRHTKNCPLSHIALYLTYLRMRLVPIQACTYTFTSVHTRTLRLPVCLDQTFALHTHTHTHTHKVLFLSLMRTYTHVLYLHMRVDHGFHCTRPGKISQYVCVYIYVYINMYVESLNEAECASCGMYTCCVRQSWIAINTHACVCVCMAWVEAYMYVYALCRTSMKRNMIYICMKMIVFVCMVYMSVCLVSHCIFSCVYMHMFLCVCDRMSVTCIVCVPEDLGQIARNDFKCMYACVCVCMQLYM